MRRWLILLGGPLIWAAHFIFIYIVASASVLISGAATPFARNLIAGSGLLAAFAASLLIIANLRDGGEDALNAFWRTVSAFGALVAAIAILWQSLPALCLN